MPTGSEMMTSVPDMRFCDLCVYTRRARPAEGKRLCQTCGANLCNEHTHVYGARPRCVDCQKRANGGGA